MWILNMIHILVFFVKYSSLALFGGYNSAYCRKFYFSGNTDIPVHSNYYDLELFFLFFLASFWIYLHSTTKDEIWNFLFSYLSWSSFSSALSAVSSDLILLDGLFELLLLLVNRLDVFLLVNGF